jgi:myosin-crossreactive antigen
LNFLNKENTLHGEYELLRVFKDTAIVKFSAYDTPTQVYSVTFNLDKQNIKELESSIVVKLIEQVQFDKSNSIEKEIIESLPMIKKVTFKIETGAEAHFVYNDAPEFAGK